METGRIRRSARRGIAVAVLGWLGVATASVLMAPGASAAPNATVEIRTVTPPAVSVDKGGQVTFVNKIDSYSTGIDLGLVGSFTATVNTDVSVTFFGQKRDLTAGRSTAWTFDDPATTGTITYTYRIVPQAGLAAAVANQVVAGVAAALPALPAPTPSVVQTLVPLPNLPSANLPQLPQVSVPLPPVPGAQPPPVDAPVVPPVDGGSVTQPPAAGGPPAEGIPGTQYTYETGAGAAQMAPADTVAASAFDPSRYYVPGRSLGGPDRADGVAGSGSGGVAGSYDGASVPVFGQLAGLDDAALDDRSAEEAAAESPAPTLPAAALAAVVALAAVFAALVRTHQASRAPR
jgi:hypothetical protein